MSLPSSSSRLRRAAAAAITGALAATMLVGTTGTAEAAGAPTTRVWITKYRNVKMPDTLRPGVHRLAVRSAKPSSFQIIKPRAGYSKREAAHDANAMFGDMKALKRFERNTDIVAGANSRPGEPAFMWARLERGRYWVLDVYGKIRARKTDTIHVRGQRLGGKLPGRATLRATGEHAFGKRPESIPGSGRLRFRNVSDANHFFGISKLKKGKTMADFEEWVEQVKQGNETEPPVSFNVGLETGVVGPGRAMSLRYDLPAGDYVMVCWWPDADMGGMPHVFMGMYRGLTVR